MMATPKSNVEKGFLHTSFDKQVLSDFKSKCQELNIPMNIVMEIFFKQFIAGDFEIKFVNKRPIEIEINE